MKLTVAGLLLSIILLGCGQDLAPNNNRLNVANKNNSGNNNSNNSGDNTNSDSSRRRSGFNYNINTSCPTNQVGNEAGIVGENGSSLPEYLVSNPIYLRGVSGPTATGMWSTESNFSTFFPGIDPEIVTTDSRFKVRVTVNSVTQGTTASNGGSCTDASPTFASAFVKIRVRPSGSHTNSEEFRLIANKGCASKTASYTLPSTSSSVVVDILEIKWDSWCQYYVARGYNKNNYYVKSYCDNGNSVGARKCLEVKLQIATDSTRDLPGPLL